MGRKRERTEIITDILSSIQEKGEIKPTHLMYRANLAHGQMREYLDELVIKEFVKKVKRNNYEYLIITDKGDKFLQKIREMKEFEKTFGL